VETGPGFPDGSIEPVFKAVALAASAGGLAALTRVLAPLPASFPAPILIVQHLAPYQRSLMSDILNRRISLPVVEAVQGEALRPGKVIIAPPDWHLLIELDEKIHLTQTAPVHFVRPSADLLFESLAAVYKERFLAVVLSGTGRDGSQGVLAVKRMGGIVIAQNRESAEFFGMPGAAIESGAVNFILPLDEISNALINLVWRGEIRNV
jgi:two-component system chemotaxis response regulator CheB